MTDQRQEQRQLAINAIQKMLDFRKECETDEEWIQEMRESEDVQRFLPIIKQFNPDLYAQYNLAPLLVDQDAPGLTAEVTVDGPNIGISISY